MTAKGPAYMRATLVVRRRPVSIAEPGKMMNEELVPETDLPLSGELQVITNSKFRPVPVNRGGRLLQTETLIGQEVQLRGSCPIRRHHPTNNDALIG